MIDDEDSFETLTVGRESNVQMEPDDLQLTLESYLRLPESLDLLIETDDVRLLTTDFPALLEEAMDFSFQQYFKDFWASITALNAAEQERLTSEFTHLFSTVRGLFSKPEGAVLDRVEPNTIELPRTLSSGLVESLTISNQVRFRLESSSPEAASFCSVEGITFRCFGHDIALRALHLKMDKDVCEIVPELEAVQLEKAANLLSSLKHNLMSGLLKIKKLNLKAPVKPDEFRQYLRDGLNLKTALREHKQDILSIMDRLADIKIDDPLTRSVFRSAKRYRRVRERIEITREKVTVCDVGGLTLNLSEKVTATLRKQTNQLQIDNVEGLGVRIPFEPPSQLEKIGVKLSKTIPNEISSLTMSLLNSAMRRKVVVGIGVNRWISCLIDKNLEPVFDQYGHWTISGVATNPISSNGQSFFLRLNRSYEIDMSVAELMSLLTDTALEGFDPINPMSWHWGIAALGTGTISSMSEGFLKERNLSELKSDALGALKKGSDAAKAGAAAGVNAAKQGASAAANKVKSGAKAAADLFKKKKD